MTVKIASLKADLNREAQGDWVEYPDWGEMVRFKVCSLHTPAYKVAQSQVSQKLGRKWGRKTIPPDDITHEYGKLYAKHILKGWEGLDQPYSPELAEELLCDPAYRELTSAVEWCAGKIGQLDVDSEDPEETGKNSPNGSDTSSLSE